MRRDSPPFLAVARTAFIGMLICLGPVSVSYAQATYDTVKAFEGRFLNGRHPEGGLIQAADGRFYGTTSQGGSFGLGTVFSLDAAGTLTTIYSFTGGSDGYSPRAGVIQAADGSFYGTTAGGGDFNGGTVFSIDAAGLLTTLHSFTGGVGEGANPSAGVIQAADGSFYGTTVQGGPSDAGTIFRLNAAATLTTLHAFTGGSDGRYPRAGVIQAADGSFYGTTPEGGAAGGGTLFKFDGATSSLTTLYSGGFFSGGVIQGPDGNLYGTTLSGAGTVFMFDLAGTFTTLHTFTGGSEGRDPRAGLTLGTDGYFYGTTTFGGPSDFGTVFRLDAAGTVTTLHSFSGAAGDGYFPNSGVIQGSDGSLYGTTQGGSLGGSIFKVDAAGTLTALFGFTPGGDAGEASELIQGSDGSFYGTTSFGGEHGRGSAFRLDADGTFTTLHSFTGGTDGEYPRVPLMQAADGNFYGTTQGDVGLSGTIFRLEATGVLTTLHTFPFTGNVLDGFPHGPLIQAADGNFYGTTTLGGATGTGTAFKVDAAGALTTIHAFGADGAFPSGGVIQAADGTFYGTTMFGGAFGRGTVFRIDAAGMVTPLHSFSGGPDGATPYAGVIQASDGFLYGTTFDGGTFGRGTVYKLDAAGTLMTLHAFIGSRDGASPSAPLIQAADGRIYGTTTQGGGFGGGTVFRLDAAGTLTTLYAFRHPLQNGTDGWYPNTGLTQAADGRLYGTTRDGGPAGGGVIFRLILDDADYDGDGVVNADDAFPFDATEWLDADGDGTGDNADLDDDDDGTPDANDPFPLDPTEWADSDGDGVGDNGDAFPSNPAEWTDTDADGTGNNADADDDGDGLLDAADNCPLVVNPGQEDLDGDGRGRACDPGDAVNGSIAFTSRRDGNTEIYVMSADGTGQIRITTNPGADSGPSWSPDAAKLAFARCCGPVGAQIYVMNADGTAQTPLTTGEYSDSGAVWSPDGTKIAFSRDLGTGSAIYLMNADGSGLTRLTDGVWEYDSDPSWSPDGTKIAYSSWRLDSAGRSLAYVFVTNADGSGETRLTTNGEDEATSPAWSPDGTKIAFTRTRSDDIDVYPDIYVMNADGSGETRLTLTEADSLPAWSPDGTKIAFTSRRDGNSEIYVMNADGTGHTRLTSHPASDTVPSWGSAPPVDTDGDGIPNEADADDDGDGIEDIVDTQRLVPSNDFSDVALGGATTGTITNRGGWIIAVSDVFGAGVQVGVSGAGAVATVATCANGGAETVELDGNGEAATVECVNTTGANTGSKVTAVLAAAPAADPRVIVKESVGRILAMLATGSVVTVGSPVTAGPNAAPVPVLLLDLANAVIGSFQLDANESVDVRFVAAAGGEEVHVTVLQGSVAVTVFGRTQTLTPASGETIFAPIPPTPTVKDLITQVNALPISNSAKTPLLAILEAADRATEKGKRTPQLKAFIVQIQNLARKGQLSAAVASDLIAQAQAIAGA